MTIIRHIKINYMVQILIMRLSQCLMKQNVTAFRLIACMVIKIKYLINKIQFDFFSLINIHITHKIK